MTVHSAKGLEFRNVFVVGMEENLFPSSMAGDSPRALEEERRLFYVAITRAEEHCYLSYAKTRMRYGKTEFGSPSRFLYDIDTNYLRLPQNLLLERQINNRGGDFRSNSNNAFQPSARPVGSSSATSFSGETPMASRKRLIGASMPRNLRRVDPAQPSSPSSGSPTALLHEGQFIEHERFGRGEVLKVEGVGDNAKATIRFQHAGDKQLLLRFARFKVIE